MATRTTYHIGSKVRLTDGRTATVTGFGMAPGAGITSRGHLHGKVRCLLVRTDCLAPEERVLLTSVAPAIDNATRYGRTT